MRKVFIKIWLNKGYKFIKSFDPLIEMIEKKAKKRNVCLMMHEFSKYLLEDRYCRSAFEGHFDEEMTNICTRFFTKMAGDEGKMPSCKSVLEGGK